MKPSARTPRFAGVATPAQQAESVREGIYVAFTSLSVTIVLAQHHAPSAGSAALTVLVTALGTVIATLVADVIANLVVHDRLYDRTEFAHAVRSSIGSLVVIVLPLLLLGAAGLGLWEADSALVVSAIALVASLVVIVTLALRGTRLSPLPRVILVGAIGIAGLLVVALQTLSHG
ncbi:hypothetical protein [Plantibacter sp. RU18]|uniref:hypothetical protein n=1 Tax=Plantibacter sp. RU18 TaxID=3158143 RepID=UPI003D360356